MDRGSARGRVRFSVETTVRLSLRVFPSTTTSLSTSRSMLTSYSSGLRRRSACARVTGAPSSPHTIASFTPPVMDSRIRRRSTRSAKSSPEIRTTERSPVARIAK